MCSPISSIDNVIRETPSESKCLKAIVLIPIVGHVVQAWKRHQLAALLVDQGESELEGRKFKEYTFFAELNTSEGRALYNNYISKRVELDGFNMHCVYFGLAVDFAIVIGGLALSIIAPVGLAIAGLGVASFLARNFIAMD